MALSDGDVAAIAGMAVGLFDDDVPISIEPADTLDPYRLEARSWTVYPMFDKHRTLGVRIRADTTPAEALAEVLRALSRHVEQGGVSWAHTFPICPGHEHASDIKVAEPDVVLRCPVDGRETLRLHPLDA